MSRKEFTKAVKRDALKRSGGFCEARGKMYGFGTVCGYGQRCHNNLAYGVEFDHELACSNGGDNSLANCVAVCVRCHDYKTRTIDTPRAAKTVRQRDKHTGVSRPKQTIKSRNTFRQHESNTKYINRSEP